MYMSGLSVVLFDLVNNFYNDLDEDTCACLKPAVNTKLRRKVTNTMDNKIPIQKGLDR